MGAYLNSQTPYTLYQSESRSPYFVDKTMLRRNCFPMWTAGEIAIFSSSQGRADLGKTIVGQVDQLVFSEGYDSGTFDRLKISEADDCHENTKKQSY